MIGNQPCQPPRGEAEVRLNRGGLCLWLTGLSGSGKTTLANALADWFKCGGVQPVVLDGDLFRRAAWAKPLSDDFNFDMETCCLAAVAGELVKRGDAVIVASTSPSQQYRDASRRQIDHFVEIFLDCSLDACAGRDPKGLYNRAAQGQYVGLPGVDVLYEPPRRPDVLLDTESCSIEGSVGQIAAELEYRGFITISPVKDIVHPDLNRRDRKQSLTFSK